MGNNYEILQTSLAKECVEKNPDMKVELER